MNQSTQKILRRRLLQSAMLGTANFSLGFSWAQKKELPAIARIIVGFPAGGAPDIIARRMAEQLTGKLAVSVVVDNRPGAGSRIALDFARQVPADGLTLLLSPAGIVATNPHSFKKLNYDPFKDIVPISLASTITFGFAVGPAVPTSVTTLADFTNWVKTQPVGVSYGSPAAGAPPHFIGEWLSLRLKLGLTHIPYRGAAPAFLDLFGGRIAALSLTLGDMVKHAEAGRLRIIGVSGLKRSPFAPNIPTFSEQGVSGLERDDWFGVYIAGKPSNQVITDTSNVVRQALTSPQYQKSLRDAYLAPAWSSPKELDQRGRDDYNHWGPLVAASGFVAD